MTLTEISGIGTKTAEILANNGFKTVRAIAGSTADKLSRVPGFGPSRAGTTISAAIALLDDTPSRPAKVVSSPKTKPVSKKAAGTKSSDKEKLRKEKLKKDKLRKAKLKKEKLRKQKLKKDKLRKAKLKKEKLRKQKLKKDKLRKAKLKKEKLRKQKQSKK